MGGGTGDSWEVVQVTGGRWYRLQVGGGTGDRWEVVQVIVGRWYR